MLLDVKSVVLVCTYSQSTHAYTCACLNISDTVFTAYFESTSEAHISFSSCCKIKPHNAFEPESLQNEGPERQQQRSGPARVSVPECPTSKQQSMEKIQPVQDPSEPAEREPAGAGRECEGAQRADEAAG